MHSTCIFISITHKNINFNTFGEVRETAGLVGVVGIFDGDESADLLSPATPSSVAVDGDGFAV